MRVFALSAAALVIVASQGFSQAVETRKERGNRTDETTQQDQNREKRRGDQGEQHKDRMNAHFAGAVLLGNNEEIALGKFAQGKTRNAKVKQFAQTMIDDHGKFGQQLAKFAPERAAVELRTNWSNDAHSQGVTEQSKNRTANDRTAEQNDAIANQTTSNRDEYARGFSAGDTRHGGPMLEANREATEACLTLTEQELSRHQGAEFDKCYIGQQIGAHIGMLAKLQAYERHAQGDLQKVFRDGAAKTQEHLDQARAIMKELESNRSSASTTAN